MLPKLLKYGKASEVYDESRDKMKAMD